MNRFSFTRVIELKQTDSTNKVAKMMINEGLDTPLYIYTLNQVSGRGRLGNAWFGGIDGLATSFVLKKIKNFYFLPYVVSYLLLSFLMAICGLRKIEIKWPNDLLVNNKKIAGILIEKIDDFYIIGIGLNVNQSKLIFESKNLEATSLFCEIEKKMDIKLLSLELLSFVEKNLTLLLNDKHLMKKYLECCKNYKTTIRCRVGNIDKIGFFKEIGEQGQLLLNCDGKVEEIWAGEIIE